LIEVATIQRFDGQIEKINLVTRVSQAGSEQSDSKRRHRILLEGPRKHQSTFAEELMGNAFLQAVGSQ
jgi:hypothetical protein